MKGYQVKQYNEPVKRYCQTLELRDNPELIAEYRRRHSREKAWPEIRQGIREVGDGNLHIGYQAFHDSRNSAGLRLG